MQCHGIAKKNIKSKLNSHINMTTMEWTREKTLALIEEYRKRRGLWDMTHEDYRKKDVKQMLLVVVSNALGGNIPITEIEKKFHTLRTQYHREINRMKRKEPYNSKWFGFKYLQFLSSPKACRSSKGRIKAEITEEGTVTTKYIIREAMPTAGNDTSAGSGNDNEEFLTLQRRPTTITYEAVPASAGTSTTSSRSHELEKLIEETTKDVDEIEETKPKMTLKEINHVPMEHEQHHDDEYAGEELQITTVESEHQDLHHIDDVEANMEVMQMEQDEEPNYQTTSSNHGVTSVSTVNAGHTQSSTTTTVHAIPTRIIKIQRRETQDANGDYYEQHHHHLQQHQHHQQHHHHLSHHQQHQQQQHHIQTISPSGSNSTATTKRIYYDPSVHTTTILTAAPPQQQTSSLSLLNASTSSLSSSPTNSKLHLRNSLIAGSTNPLSSPAMNSTPSSAALRDEFAIFGEYVANEMRELKSREILLTLKHKINTALFEASMQELQK